jgi:hypothetical protein
MNGKIIFPVPADLPKAQQHPVSSGAVPHCFAIHDFAEISLPEIPVDGASSLVGKTTRNACANEAGSPVYADMKTLFRKP